jgi:hypothetical protein
MLPYREIALVDFEFVAHPGERPEPVCLVAKLLRSGRTIRLRRNQFDSSPPYPIDANTLFVAYYASAELGCHRTLGWPMPARILDLFTEFRDRTNGLTTPAGAGLLGALTYFGLDAMGATEKDEMRALIMRGGPWSSDEWENILDYCEKDTDALAHLLPAMLSRIDLPRALLRGRYMAAAAAMEHNGTPTDVETRELLLKHWDGNKDRLIAAIDVHGVFDGRTFKIERWAALWPWSDAVVDHAMLFGSLHTVFGWHVHIGENPNPRSLRNFPMQANGAEMLRLACCLATERGIEVCAPVHDAILICAPLERLDEDVARMREAMAEASRIVLGGFELGTDAQVVRYPERYMDARGAMMWNRVMGLIAERQSVLGRAA